MEYNGSKSFNNVIKEYKMKQFHYLRHFLTNLKNSPYSYHFKYEKGYFRLQCIKKIFLTLNSFY